MLCPIQCTQLNKPNSHAPSGAKFPKLPAALEMSTTQQQQQSAMKQQGPAASLQRMHQDQKC